MGERGAFEVPAIRVTRVSKHFGAFLALDNVSLEIPQGQIVALIGASGSGKSTLLRHIAGLCVGNQGEGSIEVLGAPVQTCGRLGRNLRSVRCQLGFVFQQFNLVGRLPVITNVLAGTLGRIPLWRALSGWFSRAEKQAALDALARVGIGDSAWQRAATLSGGQQQRAAIARALVQKAKIILADEPIASLDPESARRVLEILARINEEDGTTILVSLHQVDLALRYCRRTVAMKNGSIVFDGLSAQLTPELLDALYGAPAAPPSEPSAAAAVEGFSPDSPGLAAAL
jgi:phosphonate transport system ATP-binding protein